jgi:hypothetical protein
MKTDPRIVQRIYKLMLNLYGTRLIYWWIAACPLNISNHDIASLFVGHLFMFAILPPYTSTVLGGYHNNLRNSRMMKCFSELGLARFLLHISVRERRVEHSEYLC